MTCLFCQAEYAPQGYNVGWNSGGGAGQEIFHAHLHVIPRMPTHPSRARGYVTGSSSQRTSGAGRYRTVTLQKRRFLAQRCRGKFKSHLIFSSQECVSLKMAKVQNRQMSTYFTQYVSLK
jgi:hypothetical protein